MIEYIHERKIEFTIGFELEKSLTEDIKTQINRIIENELDSIEKIFEDTVKHNYYSLIELNSLPKIECGKLSFERNFGNQISLLCNYVRGTSLRSKYSEKIENLENRFFISIKSIKIKFYRELTSFVQEKLKKVKKIELQNDHDHLFAYSLEFRSDVRSPIDLIRKNLLLLIALPALLLSTYNLITNKVNYNIKNEKQLYDAKMKIQLLTNRIDSMETMNLKANEILELSQKNLEYIKANHVTIKK